MTPELKTSCEVIFQGHKSSADPITWNKHAFQGLMSIGLCEMAKETLIQKNVIYLPKPPKKTITLLNPVVATASTFEEAVAMIQEKTPATVTTITEQPIYDEISFVGFVNYADMGEAQLIENTAAIMVNEKWYTKPLFVYLVWPVTSLLISVIIAWLMSEFVAIAFR
jgi:hypothetical protein